MNTVITKLDSPKRNVAVPTKLIDASAPQVSSTEDIFSPLGGDSLSEVLSSARKLSDWAQSFDQSSSDTRRDKGVVAQTVVHGELVKNVEVAYGRKGDGFFVTRQMTIPQVNVTSTERCEFSDGQVTLEILGAMPDGDLDGLRSSAKGPGSAPLNKTFMTDDEIAVANIKALIELLDIGTV